MSPRICAITETTIHASTEAPAAPTAPTPASQAAGGGDPGLARVQKRSAFWSSPSTRPKATQPDHPAWPTDASAPSSSCRSSRAAPPRAGYKTITAFWPASKTSTPCSTSARPQSLGGWERIPSPPTFFVGTRTRPVTPPPPGVRSPVRFRVQGSHRHRSGPGRTAMPPFRQPPGDSQITWT